MPTEWSDIPFWKAVEAANMIARDMPDKFKEIHFPAEPDEGEEAKEAEPPEVTPEEQEEFEEFMLKFVAFMCQIPPDTAGQILMDDESDSRLGLSTVYANLIKFMGYPKEGEIEAPETFTHNGVEYGLSPSEVDVDGNAVPMRRSKYIEYREANLTARLWNELHEGNLENWTLLTAVLYRPIKTRKRWPWSKPEKYVEEYRSDTVKERALRFEELPMNVVFGSYFFLQRRQAESLRDTRLFSPEGIKAARQKIISHGT